MSAAGFRDHVTIDGSSLVGARAGGQIDVQRDHAAGPDMAKRYHVVPAKRKQLEEHPFASRKCVNLENARASARPSRDSRTMLPPMARCGDSLVCALLVGAARSPTTAHPGMTNIVDQV